jgi:uncharacterized cupin superfamily protein
MVLGQVAPGGEASRHYHVEETQVVYILKGEADVSLGEAPPRRCGPGTVIVGKKRVPGGLFTVGTIWSGEPTTQPATGQAA